MQRNFIDIIYSRIFQTLLSLQLLQDTNFFQTIFCLTLIHYNIWWFNSFGHLDHRRNLWYCLCFLLWNRNSALAPCSFLFGAANLSFLLFHANKTRPAKMAGGATVELRDENKSFLCSSNDHLWDLDSSYLSFIMGHLTSVLQLSAWSLMGWIWD